MYIAIDDLREQGVPDPPSDARLTDMIELAQEYVEMVTGFVFEKLTGKTYLLDGSGTPILDLPNPALVITSVRDVLANFTYAAEDYVVYGREDVEDEQWFPRLVFKTGLGSRLQRAGLRTGLVWPQVWPKGEQNIEVIGDFGFLANGKTPPGIKRAMIRLVVNEMYSLGDLPRGELQRARGLRSESLGNYSYTLDSVLASKSPTGDSVVDGLLANYTRSRICAAG